MKKTEAAGHTTKHAKAKKTKHETTKKHHTTVHHKKPEASGHHVTVKAKHSTHAKARSLSPGDVGCCTIEALAMLLRLQGFKVSGDDVLDLHWLAGGDADEGLPIAAGLGAAWRFGLGGARPARWREMDGAAHRWTAAGEPGYPARLRLDHRPDDHLGDRDLLILGLELPGPHAVLATPDGWWSWGEPFSLADWPGAVIEEAWAVEWVTAA